MQRKNFNKKGLANEIHKKIGFSKNFSTKFIDKFFESIAFEIIKNHKLKISSFGTFNVKNKKQRIGRNPKTKERAVISSRKVLKFAASSLFKKRLNDL